MDTDFSTTNVIVTSQTAKNVQVALFASNVNFLSLLISQMEVGLVLLKHTTLPTVKFQTVLNVLLKKYAQNATMDINTVPTIPASKFHAPANQIVNFVIQNHTRAFYVNQDMPKTLSQARTVFRYLKTTHAMLMPAQFAQIQILMFVLIVQNSLS